MTDPDKAKGVIFGLAIGDAMGWPTEFLKLTDIIGRYGNAGIRNLPDQALFTDDTQMSCAIAEALIESGEQDVEAVMKSITKYFVEWYYSPENNRAPGNTCLTGVARMERGIHWQRSGEARSKGCGSAMRPAPIGYFYQDHPEKLKEIAHASGICTHGHPTADAACIGAACLVKLALDGIKPDKMISKVLEFTDGISAEFDEALLKIPECLEWDDEEKALSYLGEGWIGEEAVALALYCFLRNPDSFEKTIIRGANTDGDSDSIACIAGAISGAYHGVEAIPGKWISQIEKSSYLGGVAERLAGKKLLLGG